MNFPGMDEDFLEFESKVNDVMKLLDDISNANKKDEEAAPKKAADKGMLAEIDPTNFLVTVKHDRSSINKRPSKSNKPKEEANMDKFTFMQQIEKDANERAEALREREKIAQNFRALGNEAFRKQKYEKAVLMYTKAINHVKDSPILYNNRAISYMKLKNYKRGIMDCNYVVNKLEEKNLRSWLYLAIGYKKDNDEKNYENSLKLARKNNPKKIEYINDFIDKFSRESI